MILHNGAFKVRNLGDINMILLISLLNKIVLFCFIVCFVTIRVINVIEWGMN